jgi:hypothetical protein
LGGSAAEGQGSIIARKLANSFSNTMAQGMLRRGSDPEPFDPAGIFSYCHVRTVCLEEDLE